MKFWCSVVLAFNFLAVAHADAPEYLGPMPTRDMFPLALQSMIYQPAAPDVLPWGEAEITLEQVRSNTMEASRGFTDYLNQYPRHRKPFSNQWFYKKSDPQEHWILGAYSADRPMLFYFDVEPVRSSLRMRTGLWPGSEASIEIPTLSYSGGFMDSIAESVHKMGFEQNGRKFFPENRVTIFVSHRKELLYGSDQSQPTRVQDPILGLTQSLWASDTHSLSASLQVKPYVAKPIAELHCKSGWEFQLTGRWSPNSSNNLYYGIGRAHRRAGSEAMETFQIRDQAGAHVMWEGHSSKSVWPFVQLYFLGRGFAFIEGQKLHNPSLQHDLGFRWKLGADCLLTCRYINNLTHAQNTADFSFGVDLSYRIHSKSRPKP